jgi:hypothetical protein
MLSFSWIRKSCTNLAGFLILLQVLVAIGVPGYVLRLAEIPGLTMSGSQQLIRSATPKPPPPPAGASEAELKIYHLAWDGVIPCRGDSLRRQAARGNRSPLGFAGSPGGNDSTSSFRGGGQDKLLLLVALHVPLPARLAWPRHEDPARPCRLPRVPAPVPIG